MAQAPARIVWSIGRLPLEPDMHMLEIGGGPGVAASLLAQRMTGGSLTVIDRSPIATERTRARLAALSPPVPVNVETCAIETFAAPAGSFDLVYAINVNLFWLKAGPALANVARILRPHGRLHLFYEPPSRQRSWEMLPILREHLAGGGFTVEDEAVAPIGGAWGVHFCAAGT